MAEINVAVIGCGNIFPVHADAITKNTDAHLKAVVDINKEKAAEAAKKYNCKMYADYKELLDSEDIDVVHICTPHYSHAPIAIDFMKAGIDVLVEKPLALSVEQAEQMISTAKQYGRKLGVCFQNRFNENNMKALEIINTGKLGMIKGIKGIVTWFRDENYYKQADWRGKFSTEGGGVLINQAIHTLDLMQLFGGEIRAIQGNVSTRCLGSVIEVEDTADATIFYESGAVGIFYATNCFTANLPVQVEIVCERGHILLDGGDLKVESKYGEVEDYYDNQNSEYKSYWGYGHSTLITGFYHDIMEDSSKYTVTADEGIKTLQMIEAIYKSNRNGQKEEL